MRARACIGAAARHESGVVLSRRWMDGWMGARDACHLLSFTSLLLASPSPPLSCSAILAADMSEEEDTVLVREHFLPLAEGFKAALGGLDAASSGVPAAEAYPRRALSLLSAAQAALQQWANVCSAEDASAAAALQQRLALRGGLLRLHAVMAPGAQTAAPAPLVHGRLYDAPAACDAIDAAYAAYLAIAAGPASLPLGDGPDAATAIGSAPGVAFAYQREVLRGHSPRFVPLQGWTTTLGYWKAHLLDAHAALQAYAAASYNPHRLVVKGGKGTGSASAAASTTGPLAWKELPAEASVFPRQMCELSEAASTGLAAFNAASADAGAAAGSVPLPRLPPSGLVDPPMLPALHPPLSAASTAAAPASSSSSSWATFQDVLASDRILGDGPEATAARGIPAAAAAAASPSHTSRPHVSLHAVFNFLENFSRRNADVTVRAWAACLLWQPGPGSLPSPPPLPPSPTDPYGDFPYAEGRSAAVLGSHTLGELIRGSLLDVGLPPELLVTPDVQKFCLLCELVWRHTLRVLVGTRLRIRRRLDTVLPEWAIVLEDCELIDSGFAAALTRRAADAAYAWARAKAGLKPPSGAGPWAPVTPSALAAAPDAAARAALLRASLAAFPAPDTTSLWRLETLSIASSACRLALWAQDFAYRLQLLHLATGWETGVYHLDETAAVWWYQDVLSNQSIRVARALAVSKAVSSTLPELGRLAPDTLALLASSEVAGAHPALGVDGRVSALEELVKLGVELEDPAAAAATAAPVAAAPAPAPASGKKGGKSSGKKGGKGGGGGGDDDAALLDALAASGTAHAALETARAQVGDLLAHWRLENEVVIAALGHQHGARAQPTTEAPRWNRRSLELLQAESQLRRAGVKMLLAARVMGLWRGLERDVPPPAPGELPAFFRSSKPAFEARFRAFDAYAPHLGIQPRRLTFADYRMAFLKGRCSKAGTAQLLQDAATHAGVARTMAQKVAAAAKGAAAPSASSGSAKSSVAASLLAGAGGGAYLGPAATPEAVAKAAAASKASGGAKKGGAKGSTSSSGAPQPNPGYYAGSPEPAPPGAGELLGAGSEAAIANRVARAAVQYSLAAQSLLGRLDLLPSELPVDPNDEAILRDAAAGVDDFWEVAAPPGCGLPPGTRVAAPYDARVGRPAPPKRTTALALDVAADPWYPRLVFTLPPAPAVAGSGGK